uniref:Uncharacterized protein n=1 Tax=Gopherus agassizii TaxID=38772 RepID=A0A452GKA7_9SAUR
MGCSNTALSDLSSALSVISALAPLAQHELSQRVDTFYERLNHGKLWKHIKHKYETQEKLSESCSSHEGVTVSPLATLQLPDSSYQE